MPIDQDEARFAPAWLLHELSTPPEPAQEQANTVVSQVIKSCTGKCTLCMIANDLRPCNDTHHQQ